MKGLRGGKGGKGMAGGCIMALAVLFALAAAVEGGLARDMATAAAKLAHSHTQSDSIGSFLFSKEPSVSFPLVVNVLLAGFADVGSPESELPGAAVLDEQELQRLLQSLHHIRRPVDVETGEGLHGVAYHVSYRTLHAPDYFLPEIEKSMAEALVFRLEQLKEELEEGETVEEITLTSSRYTVPLVDMACKKYRAQTKAESFDVVILNPSWERVKRFALDDFYIRRDLDERGVTHLVKPIERYSWVHLDAGLPCHAWVDGESRVMVDLSAKRHHVGPTASAANVSPLAMPAVEELRHSQALLAASMASIVSSAVRHIFLPDINYAQHAEPLEQLLIPVLVFKNHDEELPLFHESFIEHSVKTWFPAGTNPTIVRGDHSLHDHKHISIAVSKAMRTHTTHQINRAGLFEMVGRPYLDSKDLLEELRRSGDALARGIIGENSAQQAFFQASSALPHVHDSSVADKRSTGMRVLPVYVFSLYTDMDDLTLEDFSFVHATHDAVIVLQTNNTEVEVPFYFDAQQITANGRDETDRHIQAGLAMSQGLLPTIDAFSRAAGEVVHDYTWAGGYQPFGHYSNVNHLPAAGKVVRRNFVLSRLNKGVSHVQEAVKVIDAFAEKYMHGALVDEDEEAIPWLDVLYHGDAVVEDPLFYTGTVDRLHEELDRLQKSFMAVSTPMMTNDYEQASSMVNAFVFGAQAYEKYVRQEIAAAEVELRCCHIKHTPVADVALYSIVSVVLVLVAMLILVLGVAGYAIARALTSKKPPRSQAHNLRQVGSRPRPKYS